MKKYIAVLTFFICVSSLTYFIYNNGLNNGGDKLSQNVDAELPDSVKVQQLGLIDLLNIKDLTERQNELESFFAKHMLESPLKTIRLIEQLFDSSHRRLSYEIALLAWADINKGQFHLWLSEVISNVDLDQALTTLMQRNQQNHSVALIYAEKIANTSKRQSAISNIIEVWVLDEPEQAIKWALLQNDETETWITFIFQVLTTRAPILAIASLIQLDGIEGGLLNLAITTVASNLTANQVNDELIATIISLKSYEIHQNLIGAMIASLENDDKEKDQLISLDHLAELIETLIPGDIQDQLIKLLAKNWANIDPFLAAEYAESLSGEAFIIAADGVVSAWSRNDPAYASEWLETLEGNVDIPANTLARGSANIGHIEVADKWLNEIKDVDIRTTAINDVVNEFYDADPRTGIHYLVYQKSLSEKQKLGFLHQVYPDRVFISSAVAYEELSRDGSLKYEYDDVETETAENTN